MSHHHRALSSMESPTHSSSAGLFDDLNLNSDQSHQSNPSGYSRNDRPAATANSKNSTSFKPPYAYDDGNSNNNDIFRDAEDEQRTISMIIFFLVFMVLYIGFCFYYQKKKVRARVMDGENENNGGEGTSGGLSRREQLRENQIVLDESNNAARRARANAEAMIKYKQRKMNIEKALFIRLIIDEDDEESGDLENMNSDDLREVDLECADAAADAAAAAASTSGISTGPPRFARNIVTIQEEDSDIEDDLPPMERSEAQDGASNIAAMPLGNETENRSLEDVNEDITSPSPTVLDAPRVATSSRTSTSSDHPHLTTSPSSSRPSPARSPSRRMMYADALNCGNIHSRINACSNQYAKCGNGVSSSCQAGGNATRPGCCTSKSDTTDRTISHSEMFSRYDDECNICLTQFQVGDSAAWSMQYGMMVLPLTISSGMKCAGAATCDTNSGVFKSHSGASSTKDDVCKHVFHEECISRWLLVRDGCPICRRSYFPAETTTDDTPPRNHIDEEQGVNAGSVSENGMPVEQLRL